jgi:2-C-methyl-D-erythritol 4-phosphate cytidylyltransferase
VGAELNKVYLPLAGRPVLSWSLVWTGQVAEVSHVVLVVRPQDAERARQAVRAEAPRAEVVVVAGGATRHRSEDCAFELLAPLVERGVVDVIVVHDAARPLAGPALYRSVIATAAQVGGALPAIPAVGLLPVGPLPVGLLPVGLVPVGLVPVGLLPVGPPDPGGGPGTLIRVQTPQAFRARDLLAAYAAAHDHGLEGTDTAASVEAFSALAVRAVPGSRTNLKVTYPHDLVLAERVLAASNYRLP